MRLGKIKLTFNGSDEIKQSQIVFLRKLVNDFLNLALIIREGDVASFSWCSHLQTPAPFQFFRSAVGELVDGKFIASVLPVDG